MNKPNLMARLRGAWKALWRAQTGEQVLEQMKLAEERATRAEAQLKELQFAVVEAEDAPNWPAEDAACWRQFLGGATGKRLLAAANYLEQSMNRTAILRTSGFENNAGYARGWHAATEYFFRTMALSADDRPGQVEASGDRAGAPGPAERNAP